MLQPFLILHYETSIVFWRDFSPKNIYIEESTCIESICDLSDLSEHRKSLESHHITQQAERHPTPSWV
jgi:hypothetical protein